jgi:xanthine/CO dehydrogenase XdhC/CoxF family maturation factor
LKIFELSKQQENFFKVEMTKEIGDIIAAFKEAQRQGRQTALATVVHVEGSSYRRPGARMLVEDNGKMTGAISGGCLEGDALRKALLAISQRQNKLVTYNTLDDDDVEFGVQLGCNGIVHILFEPILTNQANNPIALLEKFFLQRKNAVLVTLFSLKNFYGRQPGTCFFFNEVSTYGKIEDKKLETRIKEDAATVLAGKSSLLKQYSDHELSAFVELLQPPVSLIIAGAGNDALPLAEMATVLGWQITVADGRPTHANKQRFSKANKIIAGKPAEVIKQVVIDERTAFVLMTHNYNYDLAMMGLLLQKKCRYIGTLGPKKRLQRMLAELQDQGFTITDEQLSAIYGPTGLDIGAEAAEEIALSVLAEIKAVLEDRQGTFLRDRLYGIHSRSVSVMDETKKEA